MMINLFGSDATQQAPLVDRPPLSSAPPPQAPCLPLRGSVRLMVVLSLIANSAYNQKVRTNDHGELAGGLELAVAPKHSKDAKLHGGRHCGNRKRGMGTFYLLK